MSETVIILDHDTKEIHVSTESRGMFTKLSKTLGLPKASYNGSDGKERRWAWTTDLVSSGVTLYSRIRNSDKVRALKATRLAAVRAQKQA